MQLVKEESLTKTIAEWAAECGASEQDIIDVATWFTSHGKKAVVDIHRGVSQHTNGFFSVGSWMLLNQLLGNNSWLGGSSQLSTYSATTGHYPVADQPGKITGFGINNIRYGIKYETTTIYNDLVKQSLPAYPAKRQWYYLASDVYQEIIPSAGDAYPYPIKILISYMGAPMYSLPAGQTNIDILSDVNKIPLYIANDIMVGPTSMYADYIFPEVTYLERWEFHGSHPSIIYKVQPVRTPVAPPLTENVTVFGQNMPNCLEAMLFSIAEKANLPGFGTNGFASGVDLKHPDDFYIRMVTNVAVSASSLIGTADQAEIDAFTKARRYLPASVFDVMRWSTIAGSNWNKVIYLLNRGGAFEDFTTGKTNSTYPGCIKNTYSKSGQNLINIYQEKTATTIDAITGKIFSGIPTFKPIADSQDNPLVFGPE